MPKCFQPFIEILREFCSVQSIDSQFDMEPSSQGSGFSHVFRESICSEFWFSSALHFHRLEEADAFWHRSPLLSPDSLIPCPPVLNQTWQHLPIQKEQAVSAYYPFSYCFFFWMSLRGRAAVCPHTMKYMWWDYILRERLCTWDHRK